MLRGKVSIHQMFSARMGFQLTNFRPTSIAEIRKKSPLKSCEPDPLPTFLLKECIETLLLIITTIIYNRIICPSNFQESCGSTVIKEAMIGSERAKKNYNPVSNLPFVSKILEKEVANRLEEHLESNSYTIIFNLLTVLAILLRHYVSSR